MSFDTNRANEINSKLKQLSFLIDQLKEIAFKNVNKRSDGDAAQLCQQIGNLAVELSANFDQKLPADD